MPAIVILETNSEQQQQQLNPKAQRQHAFQKRTTAHVHLMPCGHCIPRVLLVYLFLINQKDITWEH